MGLLSPGQPPQPEPAPAPQPEPTDAADVKADARGLLQRFSITCTEVVSVDSDSILFRGFNQMARTAWIGVRNQRVVSVVAENGFNIEPSAWTRRQLANVAADGYRDAPSENAD